MTGKHVKQPVGNEDGSVFDSAPSSLWLIVCAFATFVLTAMIVAIIREERPAEYSEISGPSDAFSGVASPIYLAIFFIIPMKYESWDLRPSQKWVCRLAFVAYVSLFVLLLWTLASFF